MLPIFTLKRFTYLLSPGHWLTSTRVCLCCPEQQERVTSQEHNVLPPPRDWLLRFCRRPAWGLSEHQDSCSCLTFAAWLLLTDLSYFQGPGSSTVISSPTRTDLQMSERAHFSKSKKEVKTFFAKFKASHQCYKLYCENKNFKVQPTLGRERKMCFLVFRINMRF